MQRVPSNTLSIISDCTVRQVEFVADGKCNEELNIYPCNFDGGDCCNLEAMTSSCHEDVMSVMHNFVITTANTRIVTYILTSCCCRKYEWPCFEFQDVTLLEMDIVTMLPMMVDVILMEVIVVYPTKILNTVCFVFVMLKSQKVDELFL